MVVLFLVERVEQYPLNRPQHICRGEDHARRRKYRQDWIGLERADKDQELTHESVRAGKADADERDERENCSEQRDDLRDSTICFDEPGMPALVGHADQKELRS